MPISHLEAMKIAVEQAKQSKPEDDRPHPRVGVILLKEGDMLAAAHRGEFAQGDHAEYTCLERKLRDKDVSGATLYTTLEPCTTRGHDKTPCADRIILRRISKVVIGMLDPNPDIQGRGMWKLNSSGIVVQLFDDDLQREIMKLNEDFTSSIARRPKEVIKETSDNGTPGRGDSIFESRAVAYRRLFIRPETLNSEFLPPSLASDSWLDQNRPQKLLFGFPMPTELGVAFRIGQDDDISYAEVTRWGEIYYGEIIPNQDGLNIEATLRIVPSMLQFASKIYDHFHYAGTMLVQFKAANIMQLRLTTNDWGFKSIIRMGKGVSDRNETKIDRRIGTSDLASDLKSQAVAMVNLILRSFGIAIDDDAIQQIVERFL